MESTPSRQRLVLNSVLYTSGYRKLHVPVATSLAQKLIQATHTNLRLPEENHGQHMQRSQHLDIPPTTNPASQRTCGLVVSLENRKKILCGNVLPRVRWAARPVHVVSGHAIRRWFVEQLPGERVVDAVYRVAVAHENDVFRRDAVPAHDVIRVANIRL